MLNDNINPNTKFIAKKIFYFDSVDSTNSVAMNTQCNHGDLFVAETQTAGKGRMGRSWLSEKNCGIYMSIALMPHIPPERISLLTLVAGISVCKALNNLCNPALKIKWPNDIVADGKKICGILTEGIISAKASKAVVGIGINVNNRFFSDELTNKATSLYLLTGKEFEREDIICRVAEEFEKNYNDFINGKSLKEEYEGLCINIKREVTATKDGSTLKATAIGITDMGELIIKKEDGTTLNINSGEVSVRGIYGYY